MKNESLEHLLKKTLQKAQSYEAYRSMISDLLADGRTTGPVQTEDYIHYTNLNKVRMERLDKTTKLLPEISEGLTQVKSRITLLVITEAWCGDAAQVIPVIQKIADGTKHLDTRFILRDEHPEVMDHFLTHGSRSIPFFIGISQEDGRLLGHWGPRPVAIQDMVMARKKDSDPIPYEEFSILVQKWYAKDKTISIQKEFCSTLFSWV